MNTQGYYRTEIYKECNVRISNRPLMINCVGSTFIDRPFRSENLKGRHDFYLMYMMQGVLSVETDTCFTLMSGQAFIYPPDKKYSYQSSGKAAIEYCWAHFSGSEADDFLRQRGLAAGQIFNVGHSQPVVELFQAMFQCFRLREQYFEEEATDILAVLMTRMGRWARQDSGRNSDIRRIKISLDYLHQKYAKSISLEELAAMEQLSASRYSAVFKKYMGMSPQAFLIKLRMDNASELLCMTDMRIKEVAEAVGYDDALYFSNLFHRKTGFSPRKYRENFGSAVNGIK